MKCTFPILLISISLVLSVCMFQEPVAAEDGEKVLLIIKERYGSADIQFLENDEAILMKKTLENAGFKVDIASASGRTFIRKNVTLESDVNLAEVNLDDYAGFIITCSALGNNTSNYKQVLAFEETYSKPEEVEMAKRIATMGKPLAAQDRAVIILVEAGVFKEKKYSYHRDLQLDDAIYGGQDVVKDGNIITHAYCPYHGSLDRTVELTKALIDTIKE